MNVESRDVESQALSFISSTSMLGDLEAALEGQRFEIGHRGYLNQQRQIQFNKLYTLQSNQKIYGNQCTASVPGSYGKFSFKVKHPKDLEHVYLELRDIFKLTDIDCLKDWADNYAYLKQKAGAKSFRYEPRDNMQFQQEVEAQERLSRA